METIKQDVHSVQEKQQITKNKKIIVIGVIAVILALVIGLLMIYNSPSNRLIRQLELGQKYLVEQNYEEAILAFEQVIEIEPANVEAYLGMAQAHIQLEQLEEAVLVFHKILEIQPNDVQTYLELIALYAQQGNLEEALKICEEGYERTKDHRLNVKRQKIEELIAREKQSQGVVSESEAADTEQEVWVENGVVYFPFSMEDFRILGHDVMEDDFQKLYQSFADCVYSIDEGDEMDQEKLFLNNTDEISGEKLHIYMDDSTGTTTARIGVADEWKASFSLSGSLHILQMSCSEEYTEAQQNITDYTESPFQIGKTTYQEWQRRMAVDAIMSVGTGIELDQYGSMLWEFAYAQGHGRYEYNRTGNDRLFFENGMIEVFREQISLFDHNHQSFVTYIFIFRKSDEVLCGITVQTQVQNVPN